jgi:hypothetical protein
MGTREASSVALERSTMVVTSMLMAAQEEPLATRVAASAAERTEERRSAEYNASATRAAGVVQLGAT